MDELGRFLEESPIAARVSLPTKVVAHRLRLSPEAVDGIADGGSLVPGDEGRSCELEVGGQCVASGRIVKRRGAYYFKVLEARKGAES